MSASMVPAWFHPIRSAIVIPCSTNAIWLWCGWGKQRVVGEALFGRYHVQKGNREILDRAVQEKVLPQADEERLLQVKPVVRDGGGARVDRCERGPLAGSASFPPDKSFAHQPAASAAGAVEFAGRCASSRR